MRSRAWRLLGAIAATAAVTLGMAGGAVSANAATTTPGSGNAVTPAADPTLQVAANATGCANFALTLTPVTGATAPKSATSDITVTFGDKSTYENKTLVFPAPTSNSATAASQLQVDWPLAADGNPTTNSATVTGTYTDTSTTGSSPVALASQTVTLPSTCTVSSSQTPALNVVVSNDAGECSTFHVGLAPGATTENPAPAGTAVVTLTYAGSTTSNKVNLTYPGTSANPALQTVSWPSGATSVSNSAAVTRSDGITTTITSQSAFAKPACTATAPGTVQSDLGAAPKGHSWVTGAEIGGPAGVLLLGGIVLLARRRNTSQA